jgi:hypothetical protein
VFGGWPVLEYPPSQQPASFSVNQLVDALVKSFESKPKPAAGEERDSDKRTMGVGVDVMITMVFGSMTSAS